MLSRCLRSWAALGLLLLTAATNGKGPRYTSAGELEVPADYREWVFLSSGLDMSYTEGAAAAEHSVFDNVFVDPASWKDFKRSGHWPDKTVFVMENRAAGNQGSINKRGSFQTEYLLGLEFHVRDAARFAGGWGFFATTEDKPAALLPAKAACYSCHQDHGAVDTTFVQFYPTAKPIAEHARTLLRR